MAEVKKVLGSDDIAVGTSESIENKLEKEDDVEKGRSENMPGTTRVQVEMAKFLQKDATIEEKNEVKRIVFGDSSASSSSFRFSRTIPDDDSDSSGEDCCSVKKWIHSLLIQRS